MLPTGARTRALLGDASALTDLAAPVDLARDHVDAINANGLKLSGVGDLVGRLRATTDAAELPPCDFGIVAVKSMHTAAALEAADRLLAFGLDAAVVKMGADGVLVATADGRRDRIAPFPVDVVCGLGAGDAFGGAFCHGLLAGWDLAACARAGNAAGAIVAGRLLCADAMPTAAEIDALLDGSRVGC